MRAAIYNPYLDTLGGGERYTMAFARVLFEAGYEVDVQWTLPAIKNKLDQRFGINLEGINFVADIKRGDAYDVCFWVSDGSIPALKARKNFLHFQVPFHGVKGNTLLNKMKLFRINKIVCNSHFTKSFVDKEYGVNSIVIYPPVDIRKVKPKRKTNSILFVGRFSQLTQAKNQHVLIRNFKKFYDKGFADWELILAGGVEVGVGNYLEKLKDFSKGYPVRIVKSPTFKELLMLYGQAKIFWSAVGFGVNEDKEPEKVEHFGISVVEAMAGGSIPIVYNGGGHKEIIKEAINGFLWGKEGQLVKKTIALVKEPAKIRKMSLTAIHASRKFGYERFEAQVLEILK